MVGRFGVRSRVREDETAEVAVDTRALHFFDPENGLGIFDAASTRGAACPPDYGFSVSVVDPPVARPRRCPRDTILGLIMSRAAERAGFETRGPGARAERFQGNRPGSLCRRNRGESPVKAI